jgi:hypothetical protein
LSSGLEILIGRDTLLGLGLKAYLSQDLLEQLSLSNIHFLYQAKSPSVDLNYYTKWLSRADLGLSGVLAQEWTFFCTTLTEAGIRLHAKADIFLWNGGDRLGLLTS